MIRPVPSTSVRDQRGGHDRGVDPQPPQHQRQRGRDRRRPQADREHRERDGHADSAPTPSSARAPKATTAMTAPRISPTRSSLNTIQPTSRSATSPMAIARTMSVTVWLPMLPPVPMSSGMKKLSATTAVQLVLEVAQHRAGVGLGDEQQQQPADRACGPGAARSRAGRGRSGAATRRGARCPRWPPPPGRRPRRPR